MLSSTLGQETRTPTTTTRSSLNRASSSTSLKSSSSTCSSPPFQTQKPRNMEEVWKDINLSTLHDHSSSANLRRLPNPEPPSFILQDFLARPTPEHPPTPAGIFGDGSPLRAPGTLLSLNSGFGFDFLESRRNSQIPNNPISNLPRFNCPFESLGSPAGIGPFGKKRVNESDGSSGDQRHKRMIKNRESAARSRARKQAYTNELEREVDILLAENARLRKQQEQLQLAASSKQVPKKHTLYRTSTAPF